VPARVHFLLQFHYEMSTLLELQTTVYETTTIFKSIHKPARLS